MQGVTATCHPVGTVSAHFVSIPTKKSREFLWLVSFTSWMIARMRPGIIGPSMLLRRRTFWMAAILILVNSVVRGYNFKPVQQQHRKLLLSASASTSQIPLRIAVAGAGVGGVLLGYALEQKGFNVTVFEKTAKFSRFGGPIQLASNALSCISSLSPNLFDEIMSRFTFTGTRRCGIKDGFRNEWYAVFDAITNLAKWRTLPYTGVIDRPDLQEILLKNMKPGTVLNSMEVKSYQQNDGKATNVSVATNDY